MSPETLAREFERALANLLEERYGTTSAVDDAIRYVMSNGGKRVRPVLCLLAADAVGGTIQDALPAALALEFVHTYSLVHDDLPCMDNDDLRRGKPTAHKVFGEAQALLAGDALLTDAFTLLAELPANVSAEARLSQIRELATAAGAGGMVLGQSLDLQWTARHGAGKAQLDEIHSKKTGYLLGASAALGALAGGATPAAAARFREFGRLTGLAFQILDDLLDDSGATGKTQGKDKAAGKLTYLALMSREEAQAAADRATNEAVRALEGSGARTDLLIAFSRSLLDRKA